MTLSRKITQWIVASNRSCNRNRHLCCPLCERNIVDWVVARLSVIFFLIPTKHDTLVYRSEIRSGWRNSPSQNHTWRSTTIQHLSQILLPHHSEENGIWMNLERPKVVPWEQIGNSLIQWPNMPIDDSTPSSTEVPPMQVKSPCTFAGESQKNLWLKLHAF